MAASTAAGERFIVTGSQSTTIGVAPLCSTALTVAQKVNAVVMTSSPGASPAATQLRWSAAVQELTAVTCSTPL